MLLRMNNVLVMTVHVKAVFVMLTEREENKLWLQRTILGGPPLQQRVITDRHSSSEAVLVPSLTSETLATLELGVR